MIVNKTAPIARLVISRLKNTINEEKKYSKGLNSFSKEILVEIFSISEMK